MEELHDPNKALSNNREKVRNPLKEDVNWQGKEIICDQTDKKETYEQEEGGLLKCKPCNWVNLEEDN